MTKSSPAHPLTNTLNYFNNISRKNLNFKKGCDSMTEKNWYLGARRIFLFPKLGIVIKIPRFYWKKGLVRFIWEYKRNCPLHRTEDQLLSCRQLWTKGLRDNWMEFIFFWQYRKPFLQPTLFSFFGFINIQLYGEILSEEEFERADIWSQFLDLTNKEHLNDNHHFENGANFCVVNSHLRMIDYGSPKTRNILIKWMDTIYNGVTLESTE